MTTELPKNTFTGVHLLLEDVRVEEEYTEMVEYAGGESNRRVSDRYWRAKFDGRAHSNHESAHKLPYFEFSRTGRTAKEALVELILAAGEEGWAML